jgi:signal transduction histidine kinase
MSVDNLRQGVIYGIPLALAFYAVVSWLVLGDRRFALYACYTVSMLGALAGLNGQMTDFFFTDAPDLANDLLHIFALLSLIFSFKFAQAFLRLPILLPRLNLLFRIVIWIAVGGILLRIVGIYAPVTMLTVMLMPCTVLTPIAAALIYCQGVRYARWYILAQSIFAGMTVYGIIGIQFIWFTNNTLHYVQMVFLGELIFLAIAQQDRWRFQQQQQREAEERYQDELQKRIQLLNQQAKERVQALEQAQERSKLLDEVREVTKLVAAGHFDIRMTDSKNIDMSELVCSINSMAESLSKLEHDRRLWIAKASHELRTPLSVLQGELELLHDGFRKLDPAAVESLQEEVIHLSRLVNDLHDLAISYAQNLSCNFTEWNLCALVREVGRRYKELAAAKGITLWTVTHENQIEVKWDKGRIQQLLENLLNNSICYTDAPGSIELCVDAFPGYAAITIQDSAPGVSAEEMHMLSQPFFRSHVVSLSRKSGSGLGLAICAAIVEAHGGQISIVQSPLGGVAVKATIPLNTTASATNMQAPQPVSRIGDEAVQDEPVEAPHAAMEDISNKLLAKQGGA